MLVDVEHVRLSLRPYARKLVQRVFGHELFREAETSQRRTAVRMGLLAASEENVIAHCVVSMQCVLRNADRIRMPPNEAVWCGAKVVIDVIVIKQILLQDVIVRPMLVDVLIPNAFDGREWYVLPSVQHVGRVFM